MVSGWDELSRSPSLIAGCFAWSSSSGVRWGSATSRIIYSLFVAAILIRRSCHGFDTFSGAFRRLLRTYSCFDPRVITLSMSLFRASSKGRDLNLWLLAGTTLFLVGTLYLPLEELQSRLKPELKLQAYDPPAFLQRAARRGSAFETANHRRWSITVWRHRVVRFDHITVSNRTPSPSRSSRNPLAPTTRP